MKSHDPQTGIAIRFISRWDETLDGSGPSDTDIRSALQVC